MARLRPDFWRTFRPGAAEVPAADADMLRTDNASTTTVPWLLAMAVLVEKILARSRYPLLNPRHAPDRLAAIAAALPLPRQAALGCPQRAQRLLAVVARCDATAVAERGEHGNAHVDTDRRQRGRGRFGNVLLALDGGKPLTGAARDGDVADATRQGAPVPFAHLHPAEFRQLDTPR